MHPEPSPKTGNEVAAADVPASAQHAARERRKRKIPVVVDRRGAVEQPPTRPPVPPVDRTRNIPVAGLDRRSKDAASSAGDDVNDPPPTDEETAFMKAMERYKRENRRPFPTWSEVLEVLRALGYRKVADSAESPGTNTEMAGMPLKG